MVEIRFFLGDGHGGIVVQRPADTGLKRKGGSKCGGLPANGSEVGLFIKHTEQITGIFPYGAAGADKGLTAVVTVDGELREELSLKENERVAIDTLWGFNIVETKDGQVFVTEADCRDQICVDHKKIEKVGETIVCLPHKMVVEIIGEGEAEADMVVG